ncbi:putative anaphase-promoting complex subunit 1 [Rosellinia necatrix]|uniref:Putative anaphase-promoting complex subunit 1 n=1 Tax=Rosellinia necatrix TaxID=77044 RepID=A0A1W2TQG7_ROSNE|nr:putative anaphase-promoting complex subunit 1 [Rosellinia necatrix]
MASVTSLGLHQPTALEYAIQEQLLPENPSPSSYEWEITIDRTARDSAEDELLITKDAVIWSRGCVFRKCFGFKLEKEPITQALLTYFPVSDHNASSGAASKPRRGSQALARALVVFLKTQAHIYFLQGASHVVHMPFEVECACAAPQGVVIQRKYRADASAAASLKFPRVPPNSFLTNQLSPISMRASQQSTFSIEGLGKPKALPLRLSSQTDNLWEIPGDKNDSHWPRLVTLTDPLQDLGLVVTQPDRSTKSKNRRRSDRSPHFLDRAEEILHVEEIPTDVPTQGRDDKIILAVTANRDASTYTVWRLSYLPNGDASIPGRNPKRRKSGHRRSSMQPGLPSGATTPLQPNFKETFGAPLPGKRSRKSERVEKNDRALEKLESSLGLDKESGVTRRTSRRVSSMLARADLSASHDRINFVDQPQMPNHPHGRRDTSYGSQRNRASGVFTGPGPEELRAGGDFEGFHNMGLDDHEFDGLAQEMLFTKIHTIPIDNSNVRYSLSKQPATKQSKVFCVVGPQVILDNLVRRQVLVGFQDPMEKRLQLLTLHLQFQQNTPPSEIAEPSKPVFTFGQLKKAHDVIDSCKIVDGNISMILMLSQASDGKRHLSVQAPWGHFTPIALPNKLSLANTRTLAYRDSLISRDIGIRRAITPIKGEIAGMRHSKLRGLVDILNGDNMQLHQLRIQLEPTSPLVRKILGVLRCILPPPFTDHLLATWWDIIAWMRGQNPGLLDVEWPAIVIQIFVIYFALGIQVKADAPKELPRRRSRSFLRSSSGARIDLTDWNAMCNNETPGSSTHPSWAEANSWQWMMEENDSPQPLFMPSFDTPETDFLVLLTRNACEYMSSHRVDGGIGLHDYLPTATSVDEHARFNHAQDIFTSLHLLLEEQKLDITIPGMHSPDSVDLRSVLLQIAKWMGWSQWVQLYELEMPFDWLDQLSDAKTSAIVTLPPSPTYWSALDWVAKGLSQDDQPQLAIPISSTALLSSHLPRIKMFAELFRSLESNKASPARFVEAMHQSGITNVVLESLPEAILVPLQDAITQCQPNPPPGWSTGILELVGRADVDSILSTTNSHHNYSTNVLAPTHNASWDFSSLCQNVMEFNDAPADDTAESDKQAVIRAIFKDDRRLDETKAMLNTTKSRSIRLDPLPEWSEPFYLEQQKEVVTRLATNTLSIPAGRGLMNYGLRFPLLTQKFQMHGFVLNCIVKPQNVTVGVDKSLFTEEKIAWAFFHSGVAAGLSISPDAKGIDTSWILYNKPGNDLNNRHAGFLLALGLNGHLKDVAKWVAFKYLTPKHTMTSIGLLLGLAASYIGTMDSLITRLLSVHVTRMLPRGAAELNLSPLTQTTGIMGIGLLYCNSEHRRMSEIMMSEIEHVETDDDEEPLRTECYRLAAGFALGFINLGKGTDLKGLHDMRITEKLLTLATATKKVEQVHILDRSSAAAVVAIALIYMKSEDHIVARKIDVPDATLQFDYIRPDILLLRTVAKHLILWSEIESSHEWVRKNLPRRYHYRVQTPTAQSFDHASRGPLNSTHLPFLTILSGLCFSLALRYAGSSNLAVRDLLLSYLYRFYAQCRDPKPDKTFDDRCVLVAARMCLDVVALSCAIVMAGTCDLKVLRILRSLHGRNDSDTTYGSHMANHMAIGVLSLGCGTQTFNTSNLAIGSLLVAFYPVFPDSVQDNKSHLQAFRHFWVLATDPRCLVTKDVATNTPVSVPVSIYLKNSVNDEVRTTPCLLPPLTEVSRIRTTSSEFWNIDLDFNSHPKYIESFNHTQALYLRRRPVIDSPFAATITALGREDGGSGTNSAENTTQPLDWLFETIPTLQKLTHAERGLVLDRSVGGPNVGDAAGTVVDSRLVLEASINNPSREDMLGLKGLFEWVEWRAERVQEYQNLEPKPEGVPSQSGWSGDGWLRESVIEGLKGGVWLAGKE